MKEYITITKGLRGHFAMHVVDDEPWQTGVGAYRTAKEAVPEARMRAEAECVPFVDPTESK